MTHLLVFGPVGNLTVARTVESRNAFGTLLLCWFATMGAPFFCRFVFLFRYVFQHIGVVSNSEPEMRKVNR